MEAASDTGMSHNLKQVARHCGPCHSINWSPKNYKPEPKYK